MDASLYTLELISECKGGEKIRKYVARDERVIEEKEGEIRDNEVEGAET